VEEGGIHRAVKQSKDSVRGRRNDGILEVRQDEVVVGLEDGAGGHVRVIDGHGLSLVIDGLDLEVAIGSYEEEGVGGGVACEHVPELRGSTPVVDPKRVVHRN